MAYRYGNRRQAMLLPGSIEEYVSGDSVVRVYDEFVDCLDLSALGIIEDSHQVGNPEYDPRTMLKLLVYGYSYGIKSSRKLERAVHDNFSFVWLMGGLKPDHKTIAEFRRKHKRSLSQVLKQCAQLCLELGLIDGNVLFVDGSKVRANGGRSRTHGGKWYSETLSSLDSRIGSLLREIEAVDASEQGMSSLVRLDKELASAERRRAAVARALSALKERGVNLVNETDPECSLMHSVQGSHASYNVQSVVDDKHGLIVHADAVNAATDVNQFASQVAQAQEVLGSRCEVACADAGYSDAEDLAKVDGQGTEVVVPSQRQASEDKGRVPKPFSKSEFRYDQEGDCYICPRNRRLEYVGTDQNNGKRHYKIVDVNWCLQCGNFGVCTKAKGGRKIVRLANEPLKEKFEKLYASAHGREIYARRKQRCEHPFGFIKRNLGVQSFLLRGLEGAQAELSLWSTCFNLARMVSLLGLKGLLAQLRQISSGRMAIAAN